MIHVTVYSHETVREIALKIFWKFDVGASCTVTGWVRDEAREELLEKGQLVIDHIKVLDDLENVTYSEGGKARRSTKFRPNSVGGSIAHKIFTWERRIIDKEVRYTIWRFQ